MTQAPTQPDADPEDAPSGFVLGVGEALLDALLAETLRARGAPRRIDHRLPVPGLPGCEASFRLGVEELCLRLRRADSNRVLLRVRVGGEIGWSLPLGHYRQSLDLRFSLRVRPEVRPGPGGLGIEADFARAELSELSLRLDDSMPWPVGWSGEWMSALSSPLVEELSREALRFALQRIGRQRADFGPGASRWLSELGLDAARATLEIQDGSGRLRSLPPAASEKRPRPAGELSAAGGSSLELQLGRPGAAALARAVADALARQHPRLEFSEPELRFLSDAAELSGRVGKRRPGLLSRLRPRLTLELRPELVQGELRLRPGRIRVALPGGLGFLPSPLQRILPLGLDRRLPRIASSWKLKLGSGAARRLELDLRRVRIQPDALQLLAEVALGPADVLDSGGENSGPRPSNPAPADPGGQQPGSSSLTARRGRS